MSSFENPYYLLTKITPPAPSPVAVSGLAIQALVGVEDAGLEVFRINTAARSNASSSLGCSTIGVQALIQPANTAGLQVTRKSMAVRSNAAVNLGVASIGVQALVTAASSVGLSAARAALAIRASAPSQLGVSAIGVQALVDQAAQSANPPTAPIPGNLQIQIANFADTIKITSTWPTQVSRALSDGTSEFVSLADRPERLIEYSWIFDTSEKAPEEFRIKAALLAEYLRSITSERTLMPLSCDLTPVSGVFIPGTGGVLSSSTLVLTSSSSVLVSSFGSSGTSNYVFDLSLKRFFPGYPVGLYKVTANGEIDSRSVFAGIIDTIDYEQGEMTLKGQDFPPIDLNGAWVAVPLVYCEPITRLPIQHPNPNILVVSVQAKEVVGPLALPAFSPLNPDPLPFWFAIQDWGGELTTSIDRESQTEETPRGSVILPQESRYRHRQTFRTRETRVGWATQIMPFWDGLRGGWRPFVLAEPNFLGTPLGASGNILYLLPADLTTFDGIGYESFAQKAIDCGYAAIHYINNVSQIVQITGVENLVTSWAIYVSPAFVEPIPLTSISSIRLARVYHHAQDTVTETWYTPDAVDMSFEVLEELSISSAPVEKNEL